MQFLKTLFWVLLAVILAILFVSNPQRVDLNVGLLINARLGVHIIAALLIGFVPVYLYHRASLWRSRRQITSLEALLRPAAPPPAPVSPSRVEPTAPLNEPDAVGAQHPLS